MALQTYSPEGPAIFAARIEGQAKKQWDLFLRREEVQRLICARLGKDEWREVPKQESLSMRDILALNYQTQVELIRSVRPPLFTSEEAAKKRRERDVGAVMMALLDYYGVPVQDRRKVTDFVQRHSFEVFDDEQILHLLDATFDAVAANCAPDDELLSRMQWADLAGELPVAPLAIERVRSTKREELRQRLLWAG